MRTLTEAQLPLAIRAEKTVARIRVIGGLIGAGLTLSEMALHPPLMFAIELGVYVAAIVVGLVTLRVLPRMDLGSMPRLMWATFAADALLIGAIEPSNAWVTGVLSSPAGILLPVIGGMKFGIRGARLGTTAFALSQVVYELLRTQVFGSPNSIENSIAVVVIGAVLGAMAGRVSTDARLALDRADERTDAWAETNRQLEVMHRVLMSGVGGDARTAASRMLAELTHVPFAQLWLRRGDDLVQVAGSDELTVPGLDSDFVDALAETGEPTVVLLDPSETPYPAVAVAALRGRWQPLGALVLTGSLRGGEDAETALRRMQVLADQMSLAIQAALAYESEVAIAQRYQELDRLKTEFIAVASHELRTPLTAVNGHADTLARLWGDIEPDTARRLLNGIQDHGRRLEHLVDDLTTVGALRHGEVAVDVEAVVAEDVIAEALAGCEAPADVLLERSGRTLVLADADRLRRCIEHLICNAVEHGRPPVRIRVTQTADRVHIIVHDDGEGIPADRREQLFEPFTVARDVLAHHRGSGLGLALVKRQVLAMGGTVALADPDAGGATFLIELPAPTAAELVGSVATTTA